MRRKPYRLSPWGGSNNVELDLVTSETIGNLSPTTWSLAAMTMPNPSAVPSSSAALRPQVGG